jgi:hypothetical protein
MTEPPHTLASDCVTCRSAESELVVWERVEPSLAGLSSSVSLRLYLAETAASRRPTRALTAVGRLVAADEPGNVAEVVYAEAYHAQLDQITRAVASRDGRTYDNAFDLAASVLLIVALESTFRGRQHCGKAITSRTWSRTFVVSPCPDLPLRNRLEAYEGSRARRDAPLDGAPGSLHYLSAQQCARQLVPRSV